MRAEIEMGLEVIGDSLAVVKSDEFQVPEIKVLLQRRQIVSFLCQGSDIGHQGNERLEHGVVRNRVGQGGFDGCLGRVQGLKLLRGWVSNGFAQFVHSDLDASAQVLDGRVGRCQCRTPLEWDGKTGIFKLVCTELDQVFPKHLDLPWQPAELRQQPHCEIG